MERGAGVEYTIRHLFGIIMQPRECESSTYLCFCPATSSYVIRLPTAGIYNSLEDDRIIFGEMSASTHPIFFRLFVG